MRSPTLAAVLLMLGCTLLVAATTLFAKALGNGALGEAIPAAMTSQARFVFGALTVALTLGLRRASGRPAWVEPPGGARPPAWGVHTIRTALGWLGGFLMFTAAARMPLADASALGFVSPVATMLFAALLLGERVAAARWVAASVALVGALVLLRPGAGVIQPAAFFALGAAASMGLEAIAIKRLATTEPPGRTMLINNTMGAVIGCVLAAPVFHWPQGWAVWLLLVAMGSVMVTAQILLLTANRLADVSFVAPFWYATLIWAAVYDILAFGIWPDWVSASGAAIIVAGGLGMTFAELHTRRLASARLRGLADGARPAP
ncbi:MAG: DMT family transporter [Rhodobacter sp.]|uniref:DMT family transporter n=1 Tax=Pararhodobacter sp. TaxID=2127056 RepID=UPI001D444103|nr:DMT family transporter [Pararhodobacter sp.]MCB1344400.1 DMT family transporter [Paracoccaceae bacterium]MCC0074608.1 DMT family transporter [Rhodobacter sp.]HPD91702.1 DMT family transporter [Pararhodobacter sp.]